MGDAPLRVELLIAARDEFTDAANILSTCAFNVMNSGELNLAAGGVETGGR